MPGAHVDHAKVDDQRSEKWQQAKCQWVGSERGFEVQAPKLDKHRRDAAAWTLPPREHSKRARQAKPRDARERKIQKPTQQDRHEGNCKFLNSRFFTFCRQFC